MRFEKDLKANKKLTVFFSIVMLLAILSTVARQSGRKRVEEVSGDFGEVEITDSLTAVSEKRSHPIVTFVGYEDWGVDPFSSAEKRNRVAAGNKTGDVSPLRLSGILNDGIRASAVINGKVYTVGSRISDYVVVYISSESVILRKGDRKILLTL